MTTFRNAHKNRYTQISNDCLRDNKISHRAKGILVLLLSFPDDWVISINYIVKNYPFEGRDAVKKAINELIKAGYVRRSQTRDDDGKFSSTEFLVYETPIAPDDLMECEHDEKPKGPVDWKTVNGKTVNGKTVNGKSVNGHNKDLTKNDLTKTVLTKNECTKSAIADFENFPEQNIKTEPVVVDVIAEVESELSDQKEVVRESNFSEMAELADNLDKKNDPFYNRSSPLERNKAIAVRESCKDTVFAKFPDPIASEDNFFSEYVEYLRANRPGQAPGLYHAIAKTALRRIKQGWETCEPDDRHAFRLWESGEMRHYQGLTFDAEITEKTERLSQLRDLFGG